MRERRTGEPTKEMSWLLGQGRRLQIEVSNPEGRDWRMVEVPEGKQVIVGMGNLRREGTSTVGQGVTLGEGFEIDGIYIGPGTNVRIVFPQKGVKVAPKLTK